MLMPAKILAINLESFDQKIPCKLSPILILLSLIIRMNEILHLHLFQFPGAEKEITRTNLVSKSFADLGDAKRYFTAGRLSYVFVICEYWSGGLWPQVSNC